MMNEASDTGKGGLHDGSPGARMSEKVIPKKADGRKDSPEVNGHARSFLLSELIGRKVETQSGDKLGKLKDFVFVDDPKYAEVTHLIVGRPFGDPSLKVPWDQVIDVRPEGIAVQGPPEKYPELGPEEELLLLRDKIVDKRILDTGGFAVEVVYDIQLLMVDKKMFIVAADVSRGALMKRLHIGRLGRRLPIDGGLEGFIPWKYVQSLGSDLTATKGDVRLTIARDRLGDIHPEDLADILEELDREERIHIFNVLDSKAAAATLEATEPRVQREILASTTADRVAQIFTHLSAVEIAEVISILPKDDAEEFLKTLSADRASRVQELINQVDVPASVLAVRHFLEFPGDLTVDEAFTRFRKEAPNSLVNMYIYVVDDNQRLRGVIDINELVQAAPSSRLEHIMTRSVVTVTPSTRRTDLEALFRRYRFRGIPVVDDEGRIIGVVREKDAFSTDDEIRLSR
jgi:magnesium transporter